MLKRVSEVGDRAAGAPRTAEEKTFRTHDGEELFYRHWPAVSGLARGAVVLFHRGHEHSGRMAHLVDELDLPEFAFFAWDARGHGRSPGERGYSPCFAHVGARRPDASSTRSPRPRHRAGGHRGRGAERRRGAGRRPGRTTMRPESAPWCSPRRPSRSSSTCRSPAPGCAAAEASRQLLRQFLREGEIPDARSRARRLFRCRSADHPADLGQHPARALRRGRARRGDARAITVPTQLLISGDDWVVHHAPQHEFFVRLGSA